MSIFGDLERALADLYPYRVPLTLGAVAVLIAVATLVVRRGWHRPALRWVSGHQLQAAIAAVVVLAVTLPTGYYLLSPLWERTTLIEESPLDSATVANLVDGTGGTASEPSTTPPAEPPPDVTVTATADAGTSSDATAAPAGPRLVSEGVFEGADSFHFADGRALLVETEPGAYVLRFEDFSIRNGPDLFVYLSSEADQPSADGIRLGGLKATDGAFNYEVPAGTDISALRYAMVWCDRFAVLFATAELSA